MTHESADAQTTAVVAGNSLPSSGPPGAPPLYEIAANLPRVMHLSRGQLVGIWRQVIRLYAQRGQELPQLLQDLCQETFVDDLTANEVFWGLVGSRVGREFYARAGELLPAVYATAALIAARADQLPVPPDDQLLSSGWV